LRERCAVLAAKYKLGRENAQTLAGLINSASPPDAHAKSGPSRVCPVCGCPVHAERCFGRGADRSYCRCPRCGVIIMIRLKPPPIEYAKEYFFDLYKKQYGKTYLEDFPNLIAMAKCRLGVIKSLFSIGRPKPSAPPRRCEGDFEMNAVKPALLDIGCAYGPFLVAAKEAGFSPAGIDPAEDAVRYVQDELGIDAVHGFFPQAPNSMAESQFDAVTLWYVLEHFHDCMPVFAEISRILKSGGVLAFATPSFSGVSGRASLERFLSQSPADHWTIWSPAMCKKALALAGFTVRKIIVSGHHPERFPVFGKCARNKMVYAFLLAVSKLFKLGDTFEVYAVKN
jgi:2-polyprenyl-3-methyl-5-hydroxy-6-metoxy-1,4-benzoquinol methylase